MPRASKKTTDSAEKKSNEKSLVIVESPTKAKTISKFLGRGYTVLSSYGHVRDLPKSKIGIDTEHDFTPVYEIPETKAKRVQDLRDAAEKADVIILASDEDREGEAISWHLKSILSADHHHKFKRITFHEITKEAIEKALQHPRDLDQRLVDAQQARRVLDRLVGYELSPFLWKKVTFGLSAGRVQSVIVRLIVEREREIMAFKADEYWTIEAMLAKKDDADAKFLSKLVRKNGETLDKFAIGTTDAATALVKELEGAKWTVASVDRKTVHRSPNPPFTTSTLQQEANNRLGYSVKQTMMIAQQLYEGVDLGDHHGQTGLITYMRTDSVNLSDKFLSESRELLAKDFKDFLPEESRRYRTKAKGAQEAHEAIRPTNVFITPSLAAPHLDEKQLKIYTLIWQRAVASQMIDAEMLSLSINVDADAKTAKYGFRASGSTIIKKGFLAVYATDTKETFLPEMTAGEALNEEHVLPKQHFTEPPPRFTEASLIKLLEENGIGRPSTYAPTISTVVTRQYVTRDGRKLKPTDLAMHVNDLLVKHFPNVVDTGFTAQMEEHLDAIAEGKEQWIPVIRDFYKPFHDNLVKKDKEVKKSDLEEMANVACDKCGRPMVFKFGRNGKFMACTGYTDKKNPCKNAKPVPGSEEAMTPEPTDEMCDCKGGGEGKKKCKHEGLCGAQMVIKRSQYGQFLGCSRYPDCQHRKPLLKKTGVKCPKCKEGDIVEKKTIRGGRIFYGCSRYAKDGLGCDFIMQAKPTGQECPKCGSLVMYGKQDTIRCSSKTCDYLADAPTPPPSATEGAPAEGSEESPAENSGDNDPDAENA